MVTRILCPRFCGEVLLSQRLLRLALLLLELSGAGGAGATAPGPYDSLPPAMFAEHGDIASSIAKTSPLAVPEQLRGVFWLDQRGTYAWCDMPAYFPDLLITLREEEKKVKLLLSSRNIEISVTGRSWSWTNSKAAYGLWAFARVGNVRYKFEFSADYNFAKIRYCYFAGPWIGRVCLPDFLGSFTMTFQPSSATAACTNPQGDNKDVSACAVWRRESYFFPWFPNPFSPHYFGFNLGTYFVFRIMDHKNERIEPYFSQYRKDAEALSRPDPDAAQKYLGIDLEKVGGNAHNTSFVGTHAPEDTLLHPELPLCQGLRNPFTVVQCGAEMLYVFAYVAFEQFPWLGFCLFALLAASVLACYFCGCCASCFQHKEALNDCSEDDTESCGHGSGSE